MSTINNNITNPTNISQQISQAIKYIKTSFPPQYSEWKQLHQGEKQFQTHLNVIEYMFSKQVYAKLRSKVLDELIIKLRFFAMNESYLVSFQSYLMDRFIKFIMKGLKIVYNLGQIYDSRNDSKVGYVTLRREVQHRYFLLSQCLIYILKFCFQHNNMKNNQSKRQISQKQSSSSFKNQLVRMQQKNKIEIVSREFVYFILNVLQQRMQQVTKYNILDMKKIYPSFFSTLTDGMLTFVNIGGSKFVQSIGRLIVVIVDENRRNIWVRKSEGFSDQGMNNNKQKQKMKVINDEIIKAMKNAEMNNRMNNNTTITNQNDQNKIKQNQQKQQKQHQTFQQISKHRLLKFLLTLLKQCGYKINLSINEKQQQQHDVSTYNNQNSYNNNNFIQSSFDYTMDIISNNIRRQKYRVFINSLFDVMIKGFFGVDSYRVRQGIDDSGQLQQQDDHVLFCLVLLVIEFSTHDEHEESKQFVNKQSQHSLHEMFLDMLKNSSSTKNTKQPTQTLQLIRNNLHYVFMSKFKLLINKNKTISTQKTSLLKQLNKLIKYITFQRVQLNSDDLVDFICVRIKQLFSPNEEQMNRPLIIAIDDKNRLQGTTIGQAVPLTPLQPYHSLATYPITLTAMKQSLKFQQSRHILDQIRLFQWFQHQQTNLKLFKTLLIQFDFNSKLLMLEYFLQQLIKIKVMDGENFYGLQMSLTKFYQVLILQFYIDTLLCKQAGVLDCENYVNNKQMYNKSIIEKIKMLYSLIVSNIDMKKLLISNKEQELMIFLSLRIMYNINSFFYQIKLSQNRRGNRLTLLHSKMVIAENLILYFSHQTYLLQLLLTTFFLEFSAPGTIAQALRSIQSTLIHRNAGSIHSHNKECNLQFIKNLIKSCRLKPKEAQQLAQIYLSKDFVTNQQANSVISLLFPHLTPQTMRKCLLSIKNWPIIFQNKQNIELLSNQPLIQQPKQSLFHANDNDNVTVSNALGVIVLQLGEKWVIELQFKKPRKQILIDAMINLIQVNNQMIFWKRFFFENILPKLVSILKQIQQFIDHNNNRDHQNQRQQQKGRKILLYERIHNKIYHLLSMITIENYKYSTKINSQIRQNLLQLKQIIEKQYNLLKRECFVHQQYQYLDQYKQANALLERIDEGLRYKQQQQQVQMNRQEE